MSTNRAAVHLAALPGSDWQVWRTVCLRSAGFSTSVAADLVATNTPIAIDRLLDAEAALDSACRAVADELGAQRSEHTAQRGTERRVRKTIQTLRRGRLPTDPLDDSVMQAKLAELQKAVTKASVAVVTAFDDEASQLRERLCALASDERFREAILWQNRRAIGTGLDVLLRRPTRARDSSTRQKEQLVAKYAQRYSTKCDTIGFFGPHGWAAIDPTSPELSVAPGPATATLCAVRFEDWAITSIAEALSARPELAPSVCPSMQAYFRLEGNKLHTPRGALELPPLVARVLAACDGRRTARAIAEALVRDPTNDLASEESVFQLLRQQAASGFISLCVLTPTLTPAPEKALLAWLETVEDDDARSRAKHELDALQSARSEVIAAAGTTARLDAALSRMDGLFSELTGKPSKRFHGATYASRTLLYPTYVRDAEVTIGTQILEALAPPLSLVLASSRWFTYELAKCMLEGAKTTLQQMKADGSGPVELVVFMARLDELYPLHRTPDDSKGSHAAIVRGLHERWQSVLSIPQGSRRVARTARELADRVTPLFAAPSPGFPDGRHASPDVMIGAKGGLRAIRRGDFFLVLGELHPGNTLENPFFINAHPVPEEIYAALRADHDRPRVSPTRRTEKIIHSRIMPSLKRDFTLAVESEVSWRPRSQIVRVADLVVDEYSDGIEVRLRDGRHAWDIVQFFTEYLMASVAGSFNIVGASQHSPRVTIDRLVVVRESWSFAPDDLRFAHLDTELQRWIGARRWARNNDLPCRIFVKAPEELKPMFVDFDSPVLIETMCNLLRRSGHATVSEMLPDLEEAWLVDRDGKRYVSELRLVALDPEPWKPLNLRLAAT